MADVSETLAYDPRYDQAQSVDGAKARYVDLELVYTLEDLEQDLERLL